MSEEEKKAIEYLKKYIKWETYGERSLESDIKTTLNYIDKLQKENENLNKKNKRYEKYLKNKDIEHEKVLEYIETEKERDYISKDIIRNKIKELGEIKGDLATYIAVTEKMKILNELLGE